MALAYGAHAKPAQQLADELVAGGGHAMAVGADLRRSEAPARAAGRGRAGARARSTSSCRRPGLAGQQALEEVSLEDFDEMVAVNLRAPVPARAAHAARDAARGFGRVLFLSSVAGFTGGIVGPHYAASKSGLHGLTHFLAARVAGDGVTVNAIAPALIADTGMLPGDPEELRVPRAGRAPRAARRGRGPGAWRCCATRYMTSQVVSVDGGMYPH